MCKDFKAPSFPCHLKCLLVLLQYSQQICNTLFCSRTSAIDRPKDASDQLIQWLKTSPDVRRKLLVHACIIGFPALTRSCTWIRLSSPLCYVTAKSEVHVVNFRQASGSGYNDESLGTKELYSITHLLVTGWGRFRCCRLTCHQTGISLWEHPLWKKEHLWYLEVLLLTCPLQTWLTSIRRCCKQVWTIYLAENDSAPWMAR